MFGDLATVGLCVFLPYRILPLRAAGIVISRIGTVDFFILFCAVQFYQKRLFNCACTTCHMRKGVFWAHQKRPRLSSETEPLSKQGARI